MSSTAAIPVALASAVAYGSATAAQHSAAHEGDQASGAWGLIRLLRDPRWLLGMAGDTVGLALQILALATGPVILVQPLLVLALPVSLPVAWLLGGARPRGADYRSCIWIAGGLALFFVLVGNPGRSAALSATATLLSALVVVACGTALLGVAGTTLRRRVAARAAVMGGVAGAWFGYVAVLMDSLTAAWGERGVRLLSEPPGLVPLIVLVAVGAAGIALTQAAFQIGALGATVPANLVADPIIAIALGAALLHENLPLSPIHIAAYAGCLAAVVLGSARLAAPRPGPLDRRPAASPPAARR